MGKVRREVSALADQLRRARGEAEGVAKALNSVGAIPDGRPGFAQSAANVPRADGDQQFSTMARRLGL